MSDLRKRLRKLLRNKWVRTALIIVLLALLALTYWSRADDRAADMSLSDVRKQTIEHKVKSAEIKYDDHNVVIVLKETGKRYESSYPNEYDDDLIQLFEKNSVPVKAIAESWWMKVWKFVRIFLPMIVILIIFQILGKRSKKKSVREIIKPPSTTFADVGANEEVITELEEMLEGVKNPQAYRDAGLTVPKGVLLHGPPGTGKTLLARAVAGEAKLPFFATSGSSLDDKYAGGSAEKVRHLYKRARAASVNAGKPAIVFIDEIDAIAPKRSDRDDSVTRDDVKTLNQLLELIDGFEKDDGVEDNGLVVTIAATNRKNVLDDAILRRLPIQILVPLPNQNGRKKILELCLRKFKNVVLNGKQLDDLSKLTGGMSGSGLADLVNEAGRERFHSKKEESEKGDLWSHFQEALLKVKFGPEREFPGTDDQHLRAAARAAGQAVVALSLGNIPNPLIVTGKIRGEIQGAAVLPEKPDDHPRDEREVRELVAFHVAGRAAEQLLFEQVTSASRPSMELAANLAAQLVCEFSSSALVPRVIPAGDWKHDPQAGDIVGEVNHILEDAAVLAGRILRKNESFLRELAKILQERSNSAIEPEELKRLSLDTLESTEDVKHALGFTATKQ